MPKDKDAGEDTNKDDGKLHGVGTDIERQVRSLAGGDGRLAKISYRPVPLDLAAHCGNGNPQPWRLIQLRQLLRAKPSRLGIVDVAQRIPRDGLRANL